MSRPMEDSLDMPLRDVLAATQERIMKQSTYFGIKTLKSPMDFWVYQEIIFSMKPDVIVEVGNHNCGNTLALAHLCDAIGHGRVIGVDIFHKVVPDLVKKHPRISLVTGDAVGMFNDVRALIKPNESVLVIEDSAHTYENTLGVLRAYSALTKKGDYFIVEDSICHHGLDLGPKPGPYEAIETFVAENKNFVVDRDMESFPITWNPKGYLRRVK